jgi:3-oxoacyl-[acyl-carrier-protein] synthase III
MFATEEATKSARDYVRDMGKYGEVAKREMPGCLSRVLEGAGKGMRDIDGCFFTPMTRPVEAAIRKEAGIPYDKFHSFVRDFGRCESGAIPVAMLARAASQLRAGRHTALLGAMGAGLAWSSAVITTENVVCPEIIEL